MSRIESHGVLRQREPRIRDKAYMGWIAQLPCLACIARHGRYTKPVQVCHIRAGYPEDGWRDFGKAEKPHDRRTWPGCPACHMYGPDSQHAMNERVFWERLMIHPPALCAALVSAYEAGEDGTEVLRRFAYGRT